MPTRCRPKYTVSGLSKTTGDGDDAVGVVRGDIVVRGVGLLVARNVGVAMGRGLCDAIGMGGAMPMTVGVGVAIGDVPAPCPLRCTSWRRAGGVKYKLWPPRAGWLVSVWGTKYPRSAGSR